jgi:hypothetical protein
VNHEVGHHERGDDTRKEERRRSRTDRESHLEPGSVLCPASLHDDRGLLAASWICNDRRFGSEIQVWGSPADLQKRSAAGPSPSRIRREKVDEAGHFG